MRGKKRPSVRLPVAPPSRPHRPKTEYRRGQEKKRLRRDVEKQVQEPEEPGGEPEDDPSS